MNPRGQVNPYPSLLPLLHKQCSLTFLYSLLFLSSLFCHLSTICHPSTIFVSATREINPHSKFLYAAYTHQTTSFPTDNSYIHSNINSNSNSNSNSNNIPLETVLIDYQIHLAPSGDFTGKIQEEHAKYAPGENDEERHVRPAFLHQGRLLLHPHYKYPHYPDQHQHQHQHHNHWQSRSKSHTSNNVKEYDEQKETYNHNNNRVVQFYNPWSGPSQQYVKTYIELALELNAPILFSNHPTQPQTETETETETNTNTNTNKVETQIIKFYAISCSAHHWVCKDNDIRSYPTLYAFPKESTESIVLDWKTLTVDTLRDIFQLPHPIVSPPPPAISTSTTSSSSHPNDIDIDIDIDSDKNQDTQDAQNTQNDHDVINDITDPQEINSAQEELSTSNDISSSSSSSSSTTTSKPTSMPNMMNPTSITTSTDSTIKDTIKIAEANIDTFAAVDILGASEFVYQRVKRQTYSDAITSFTYALEYDIFPSSILLSSFQPDSDSNSNGNSNSQQDYRTLTPEQKDAFIEWIDLLYWALPSNWRLQTLIHDIRSNMDYVLQSRDALIQFVYLHHDVVHEGHTAVEDGPSAKSNHKKHKKHKKHNMDDKRDDNKENDSNAKVHAYHWSSACTQSDKDHTFSFSSTKTPNGYTCGLWNLIHILTMGIAERHSAVLGARDRASVVHTIHTITQYLRHFTSSLGMEFSLEDKSRQQQQQQQQQHNDIKGQDVVVSNMTSSSTIFLKEQLLKCTHHPYHHCRHLYSSNPDSSSSSLYSSSMPKTPAQLKKQKDIQQRWQYQQMAIFVWEVHNQYNVEVWKHRIKQRKGYIPHNKEEEREVMWPQRELCYSCHDGRWRNQKGRGGWDLEEVFEFLKSEYWPNGVHNFRYVVLEKRPNVQTLPNPPFFHFIILSEWSSRSIIFSLIGSAIILYLILSRWNHFQIQRTGRHKKFETESV